MDDSLGIAWAAHVAVLSYLAVGGGFSALVPELHRFAVETNGWLSSEQFTAIFAVAQAAPGPNALFVTLVGWEIGGWIGAAAATVAVMLPCLTVTLAIEMIGRRPDSRSRLARALRDGLAPVAVALFASTGWVILDAGHHDWRGIVVALAAALVVLRYRINPVWAIAAGAVLGAAGWV